MWVCHQGRERSRNEPPVLRERQPLRRGALGQDTPDLHYRLVKPLDDGHRLARGVEDHGESNRGGVGRELEVHARLGAGDGGVQYIRVEGREGER